jgi:hypothetical protein
MTTMQQSMKITLILYVLPAFLVAFLPVDTLGKNGDIEPSAKGTLQQRIDFGNSQILGQSIKSGAVYLMHRKKSDITTMIEVREHYRNEIMEDFEIDRTAIPREDSSQ